MTKTIKSGIKEFFTHSPFLAILTIICIILLFSVVFDLIFPCVIDKSDCVCEIKETYSGYYVSKWHHIQVFKEITREDIDYLLSNKNVVDVVYDKVGQECFKYRPKTKCELNPEHKDCVCEEWEDPIIFLNCCEFKEEQKGWIVIDDNNCILLNQTVSDFNNSKTPSGLICRYHGYETIKCLKAREKTEADWTCEDLWKSFNSNSFNPNKMVCKHLVVLMQQKGCFE